MSPIYKNIKEFSLLIAGLIMLAHSMIPHDHHYDSHSELYQHHHECEHSNEKPIHCHFLNTIDFDFVKTNTLEKTTKKSSDLIITAFFDLFDFDFQYQADTYFRVSDALHHPSFVVFNSPTRGSPFI